MYIDICSFYLYTFFLKNFSLFELSYAYEVHGTQSMHIINTIFIPSISIHLVHLKNG